MKRHERTGDNGTENTIRKDDFGFPSIRRVGEAGEEKGNR